MTIAERREQRLRELQKQHSFSDEFLRKLRVDEDEKIENSNPSSELTASDKIAYDKLERFRQQYLKGQRIQERKAVYISENTRNRLGIVVRRLGEYETTLSSYIEQILLKHLERYERDIDEWRKL